MINWKDKSIIIAEDDYANYLLLKEYLDSTGIRISRARTGMEVLELCDKMGYPDMILMDIKMPVMSGYEAVIKIREENKKIPIIAQTAHAMAGDKENILAAGCNEYLAKPITEADLLNTIRKYLG
jgi:CheY-like chemotaxis protein